MNCPTSTSKRDILQKGSQKEEVIRYAGGGRYEGEYAATASLRLSRVRPAIQNFDLVTTTCGTLSTMIVA